MQFCPCQSQKTYDTCCGVYLEKNQNAQTPEQLMRSRYTAYSLSRTDYIKKTMQGKALVGFNEMSAKEHTEKVTWTGLKVIRSYLENPEKGFVEFAATFLNHDQLHTIHELSEFHLENNRWFYIDGQHIIDKNKNKQKIGRNSPCPCGSGKKFKNCHER